MKRKIKATTKRKKEETKTKQTHKQKTMKILELK